MILSVLSNHVIIEIIGYVASAVVLLSFLFKNVKVIRIVNIVGATIFVIYGLLLPTYPTALMNFALIVVHCVYLIQLHKKEKIVKKQEENIE